MKEKSLEKVNFKGKDKEKAVKLVNDIIHSMSFFLENLANWELQKDDVKTFMGLFESYFTELSPLVGYDSVLVQERKGRNAKIRELNTEIARLQSLIGQEISPEAVSGFLRNCDNIFRAWYGSLGFRYASLERFSFCGVFYEFSDEIDYGADDGLSSMEDLAKKMQSDHIILAEQEGWDITRDKFHGTLLDTDRNKQMVQSLFQSSFPGCDIVEYRSRKNDYGSYSIRVKIYIPYTDICKLTEKYNN